MTVYVLVYEITTSYTGTWAGTPSGPYTLTAGNFLHVKLDDVANTLSVEYSSSSTPGAGTIYGTITEGPYLYADDGVVSLLTGSPFYQYCESTTLHKIGTSNGYPYATLSNNLNNSECQLSPVCDLEISSLYSITEASGPATADGAITISATSSNGTIKYSMDENFIYATEGQTSPTFSALYSGAYTIYAKDEAGCLDSVYFEIPVTTVYGVRFRLDFTDSLDISKKFHRVDILERAYTGTIFDICGDGPQPIIIRYKGDPADPSKPLIASDAEINLTVETQGYFNDLYTGDDRQFLVKYYNGVNEAGITIYWTGYIIPEFHSEPYLFEPYILTVMATDQIGELKNQDFLDLYGNVIGGTLKSIKVIAEVLKKTGLNLNIISGVNVFDSGMTTAATDDPYDQAYVDARIYYGTKNKPDKCNAVLESFVTPFRGQIFQSMGSWWIIRLSDAVVTFPYRVFDSGGDYLSNSTIDPIKELDVPTVVRAASGAMFANRTQLLSFMRNYGYFSVTHDLKKDGNLIDEGRFEAEDIQLLASGNVMFKNFNFTIGQGGVTFGLEEVDNGDSLGAFYADYTNVNNAQADSILYSNVIPLNSPAGKFRLKFQYHIDPQYTVPYVRIAWALKMHNATGAPGDYIWLTYGSNGALTFDTVEQINEIYVEDFNSFNTFDLYADLTIGTPVDDFQIFIYFHNHYSRDYSSLAGLRAFDPSTLSNPGGTRRMLSYVAGETNIYVCEYVRSASEVVPDLIVPDVYDDGDGDLRWVWRLDEIINLGPSAGLVRRFKFDNLSLAFHPNVDGHFIDPPKTLVYDNEVSTFVKSNLNQEVLLGDMIRFHDVDTRNEANIYRSYFRLSDDTPTRFWARSGVSEAMNLLNILLADYISQFSDPQRKLTGSMATNTVLHFINCIRDGLDSVKYRPMTFEFDPKQAMYNISQSAVSTGAGGDPPAYPEGILLNEDGTPITTETGAYIYV